MSKFAVVGLLFTAFASGAEPVVMGYADYRPLMSHRADGTPGGFAFDVLNEAARREGIKLAWKFIGTATPDDALASGKVDLWPAAIDSPQRQKQFHVTTSWWRNELQLLTIAGNRFRSVADLSGKRVTSVSGLSQYARKIPKVQWLSGSSHESAAEMVCAGSAEAALLDRIRLDRILLRRPALCRDIVFNVVPIPDAFVDLSILSARRSADIAEALRRRIDDIAEDGTLASIALRHPPVSSASADRIAAGLSAQYHRERLRWASIGAALLLLASAMVIYVLVTIGRAQKKTLLRLEESEARFRVLVDAMPQLVWSMRQDGTCEFLSGQWHQYTGTAANDWLDPVHPDDRERTRESLMAALAGSQPWTEQYRLRRRDGQYRWFEARGVPVKVASTSTLRWIGASSDIDDSKRAAEALQLRNDHLQQFAWAVSHDLQEPLRMVITFSQMLQKRFDDSLGGEGREYISQSVNGARRIESLLHDLRDYWSVAGERHDNPDVVNLASAADEAMRNLQSAIADAGATVDIDALPNVLAEKTAVTVLLQNLISNAVKYRHPDRTPLIHVRATQSTDTATIAVEDNGIGIEAKYVDVVFDVFRRLHSRGQYQGNGIGLALCRRIVERHGGKIWVESEVDRGSTFYFTLRLARSEASVTAAMAQG